MYVYASTLKMFIFEFWYMLVAVIALISFDDDQMVMDECDVNFVWSDSSMGSLA